MGTYIYVDSRTQEVDAIDKENSKKNEGQWYKKVNNILLRME